MPIFALANAGVHLSPRDVISDAASSPVTLGIVLALVVGKLVGIWVGAYAPSGPVRDSANLAPGPEVPLTLAGGAALSGIGFTISLFIVDLALDDPQLADEARIGVLSGSVLAALVQAGRCSGSPTRAPR